MVRRSRLRFPSSEYARWAGRDGRPLFGGCGMSAVIVKSFSAIRKNTLRGFATVQLPSGMIVADVGIHTDSGRAWASPPSKPMLSRDGAVMRDDAGKVRYSPIITFASKELRNRFSAAIVDAMETAYPGELA